MNEFIIWDSKYKLFLDENFMDTLQDNEIDYEEDDLYYGDEYYPLCVMDFIMGYDYELYKDRISKLFYIGLNDINNNKIYADCSIIEFNYTPEHAISFGGMEINEDYKIKGFFSYNSEELGYKIIILEGGLMFDSFIMNYSNKISNIKIIDTIQENKLGLMD